MTYAKRTDANHGEIKRAFEKMGVKVFDASRVGGGFPDLVLQYGGVTMLAEIKTAKGKQTASQKEFPLMARLVRSSDDVAETVRVLRRWHTALTAAALK